MKDDKIELRSEKVRTIIGEIPSRVVRYGIIVITIVISGLLAAAYFIPYPETIDAKIMIKNETQGTIAIPYKYINTVRKGMTVSIELEGFDRQRYGMTTGLSSLYVEDLNGLRRVMCLSEKSELMIANIK